MAKTPANNLPAVLEGDEFQKALAEHGFLNSSSGGTDFHRLTIKGTNIYEGDDLVAVYNQKTKEPALYVQLVDEPNQYQALWFDKNGILANAVGRPNVAGKFCKSHFNTPGEERNFAEDGTNCNACPVHPFVPKNQLPPEADDRKCAWKADIEFRILAKQEDGTLKAEDDTIYTMTLSTTGIIEFVGSGGRKNDPMAGSVSPQNTNVQIAALGMKKWGPEGIAKAKLSLTLGGVICELHIPQANSEDGSRSWTVPSFKPIEILEPEEVQALPDSTAESKADGTADPEEIPF